MARIEIRTWSERFNVGWQRRHGHELLEVVAGKLLFRQHDLTFTVVDDVVVVVGVAERKRDAGDAAVTAADGFAVLWQHVGHAVEEVDVVARDEVPI